MNPDSRIDIRTILDRIHASNSRFISRTIPITKSNIRKAITTEIIKRQGVIYLRIGGNYKMEIHLSFKFRWE